MQPTLVSLFSGLDQHFQFQLEPALLRARRAASSIEEQGARLHADALIDSIERVLRSHELLVRRRLSPIVAAVDAGVAVKPERRLLNRVHRDHLILSEQVNGLVAAVQRLPDSDFSAAAAKLIAEINEHITFSRRFILPRFG